MEQTVKVIVSGDGGVGKTSFLDRLVYNDFNSQSELTRGVDFYSQMVYLNETELNFILWDFAGQNQFKNILNNFVEGLYAAIILFDLTRISSIENLQEWVHKLKEVGEIPILILGTKMDLIDEDSISPIDDYINDFKLNHPNIIDYIKISSKTGQNVKFAFETLIDALSK